MSTEGTRIREESCDLDSLVDINATSVGRSYPHAEIEYIDISSVGSGTQSLPTVYRMTDAPGRARRLVAHGDTLLATVRPNLRSFLFIKRPSERTVASTGFAVLRPKKGVDPRFVYYTVTNQGFTDYLTSNAKGSAYPAVDVETIKRAQVFCPSPPVQRKIAAILSAYDDLIENNTRRIQVLEEMAQALYREWFVHFHFPGHEQSKMVDSALGPIPQGWKAVSATTAIEFNPRTQVPRDGEKPFVPMGSLSEDSMLINNIETRSGNSGAKFKNGDTLFARITPCLENGKTGYVQFLPTEQNVAFGSTEFIVMRSRTVCPEFVYLLARSSGFRDNAIKSMSGATGRQRVQEAAFDRFLVALPDAVTLREFSDFVSPMFASIKNLADRNGNMRRTRDLLLPKLISGEVAVDDLDIETGEHT